LATSGPVPCALVGLPPPRPPSVLSTSLTQSPAGGGGGRGTRGVKGKPRVCGDARSQKGTRLWPTDAKGSPNPTCPPPSLRPSHYPPHCPPAPLSRASRAFLLPRASPPQSGQPLRRCPPADSCLVRSCGTPAYAIALSSPAVTNSTGSDGCFFWMAFHASCGATASAGGRRAEGEGGEPSPLPQCQQCHSLRG
jgi:hypothetical protein